MNVEMEPFDDVKVRQALSWAIDRDKLVKLQGGQAMSLWQFYPKGMPGYEEGKVYYGYDPAKAKQLLADAGYPDGFKTMLYTDNVDPNPKLWTSVQADLAAVGVEAELKTMSNNTYYSQQGTPKTLTAGSFGWWMDFPDPSDWIAPLFSKASAVRGRHELQLLVEPGAREDVHRGAGHDRPGGAHRQVHGDAAVHRRRRRRTCPATSPSRPRCAARPPAGSTCTRCTRSTRRSTGRSSSDGGGRPGGPPAARMT